MTISSQQLDIPGCHAFQLPRFSDTRGDFTKIYNKTSFANAVPDFKILEAYLSVSQRGVLRGMHFQLPPHAHQKIVACIGGSALDAILDLRPGPGYGKVISLEISPNGTNCIVIPVGCAHGFYAREDGTSLMYFVGTEYAPEADAGIRWDSIGFEWPLYSTLQDGPILSDRDRNHPKLADFVPPRDWQTL